MPGTYKFGLLVKAICDTLLEALQIFSDVSLLFQKHVRLCYAGFQRLRGSESGRKRQKNKDWLVGGII